MKRFLAWRWWRGWRGWLIFTIIAAVTITLAVIALARVFSPPPEPWSQFPGVPQVTTDQVLANQTIEQLAPRVDAAMADIRTAVTAEFGFDWVAQGEAVAHRESNRYHGTSLLNTWDSVTWQTIGTLRDRADKDRAVAIVTTIMKQHGFGEPALSNIQGPDGIELFGGFTLDDQGRWLLEGQPPEVSRGSLQFTILDLTQDRTGILTTRSDAAVTALGWEPEYLSISYHGDFMLSEADRAEFERRAELYKGHIAPVPGRNKD